MSIEKALSRDGASILETIGKIEEEYNDPLYVSTPKKCDVSQQVDKSEPVSGQLTNQLLKVQSDPEQPNILISDSHPVTANESN